MSSVVVNSFTPSFCISSSSQRRIIESSQRRRVISISSSSLRASFDEDGGNDKSVTSAGGGGLPPLPSQQRTVVSMEKDGNSSKGYTSSSTGNVEKIEGEEKTFSSSYPINLPSPILLASSMILAISSTGSLYELAGGGGGTTLGLLPTLILGGVGLPTSVFLIYAAIRKGAAETEEDDKEYSKQNNARKRL